MTMIKWVTTRPKTNKPKKESNNNASGIISIFVNCLHFSRLIPFSICIFFRPLSIHSTHTNFSLDINSSKFNFDAREIFVFEWHSFMVKKNSIHKQLACLYCIRIQLKADMNWKFWFQYVRQHGRFSQSIYVFFFFWLTDAPPSIINIQNHAPYDTKKPSKKERNESVVSLYFQTAAMATVGVVQFDLFII